MDLFEKINADIKSAMLAKDKVRLETLRGIKKEFIEVQQDSDTGEYISANVFSQLLALSNEY